jgi:carboxypeptidase C (cathepsin A)
MTASSWDDGIFMRPFRLTALALLALLSGPVAWAQDQHQQGHASRAAQAKPADQTKPADNTPHGAGVLRLLPPDSVTEKEITLGGRKIAYTATAGTLALFDQSGEKTASVFYTAYVAKDSDTTRRPMTFAFNGGPGAASAYINLGFAGPRLASFGPSGRDGADPTLVDNPDSWLAFTDLVMIDPIGTGWSRTAKPDDAKNFYGVRSDASVIAKVIALYVAKNSRNASPKYLLGESYGGFRAAKVASALQRDQGTVITGIVMVSPLLEASFQWSGSQTALGAALQFPTYVATELERTKKYTPEAMAQAERFALNEYLPAMAGPAPTGDKAAAFYGRVADLTGLSTDVVAKSRGFIRNAYLQHLRANGQTVSSYDATFAVPDPYPESERRSGGDAILDGFSRALSGVYVAYARDELGFKTDMTYNLLSSEVSSKWDWGDRREPPGVSDDLRELLAFNPSFRVLVVHGRTDFVTPYGVSRYVLDHIPSMAPKDQPAKDAEAPDRVQLKLYRGGHMFYFDPRSRADFTADAKGFYQSAP